MIESWGASFAQYLSDTRHTHGDRLAGIELGSERVLDTRALLDKGTALCEYGLLTGVSAS